MKRRRIIRRRTTSNPWDEIAATALRRLPPGEGTRVHFMDKACFKCGWPMACLFNSSVDTLSLDDKDALESLLQNGVSPTLLLNYLESMTDGLKMLLCKADYSKMGLSKANEIYVRRHLANRIADDLASTVAIVLSWGFKYGRFGLVDVDPDGAGMVCTRRHDDDYDNEEGE